MNHSIEKLGVTTQDNLEIAIPITNTTKEANYNSLVNLADLHELVIGVVVLNHANRYYNNNVSEACIDLAEHTPYKEQTLQIKTITYKKKRDIKLQDKQNKQEEAEVAQKLVEQNKLIKESQKQKEIEKIKLSKNLSGEIFGEKVDSLTEKAVANLIATKSTTYDTKDTVHLSRNKAKAEQNKQKNNHILNSNIKIIEETTIVDPDTNLVIHTPTAKEIKANRDANVYNVDTTILPETWNEDGTKKTYQECKAIAKEQALKLNPIEVDHEAVAKANRQHLPSLEDVKIERTKSGELTAPTARLILDILEAKYNLTAKDVKRLAKLAS